MNFVFPEKLKRSRGIYTDDQVARCCQLGGQFGRNLEAVLLQNISGGHLSSCTASHHINRSDVQVFVEKYRNHGLWENIPGRAHPGFEKMKHDSKVKDCGRLAKRLNHLSYRIDVWKKFTM